MGEIEEFVAKIRRCRGTLEKIEVFKNSNFNNCRIYLFDEENSNFKYEAKNIKYSGYNVVGLGDYEKAWIIDEQFLRREELEVAKVINYDLNIITYMDNYFRGKNIPGKDEFVKLLSEIKERKFTNNISTALMERYSTPLDKKRLSNMIKSFVYFDSYTCEKFIDKIYEILDVDKYKWMKKIYDESEYYLKKGQNKRYDAIVCYILKAVILKNDKKLSEKKRLEEFKKYCFEELNVYMELEISILILYLKNDDKVKNVFKKLQIGAKDLLSKIYNVAWDIFHIRLLEIMISHSYKEDRSKVFLHYFATADLALAELLNIYKVKMLFCFQEKEVSIRDIDDELFSEDDRDKYFNEEERKRRFSRCKEIDYHCERLKLEEKLVLIQ